MSPHPLENWLGVRNPGTYKAAEPHQDYAFVKIEDMWSDEELEEDDSDQDEDVIELDTPAYKRRELKEKISLPNLFLRPNSFAIKRICANGFKFSIFQASLNSSFPTVY